MNSNLEALKAIRTNVDDAAEKRKEEARKKQLDIDHAAILEHQTLLLARNIWRSCLNCQNFVDRIILVANQKTETYKVCGLFSAVPPPNIIVNGCRDWEDDIPF